MIPNWRSESVHFLPIFICSQLSREKRKEGGLFLWNTIPLVLIQACHLNPMVLWILATDMIWTIWEIKGRKRKGRRRKEIAVLILGSRNIVDISLSNLSFLPIVSMTYDSMPSIDWIDELEHSQTVYFRFCFTLESILRSTAPTVCQSIRSIFHHRSRDILIETKPSSPDTLLQRPFLAIIGTEKQKHMKRFWTALMATLLVLQVSAHEGMWHPHLIKTLNHQDMTEHVYSPRS